MILSTNCDNLSHRSENKILVKCQFGRSTKCLNEHFISYRAYIKNINNNKKYICLQCSRTLKFSGRKNPNMKYNIDDNFFKKIDSRQKAYLLGWIGSDGHISKSGFKISINQNDLSVLVKLRDIICHEVPIKRKDTLVSLSISSSEISKDLCNLFNLKFDNSVYKKSHSIEFPNIPEEFKYDFIRGYFEGDGYTNNTTDKYGERTQPIFSISSNSKKMISSLYIHLNIPFPVNISNEVFCQGVNAVDILGKLYDNCEDMFLERKYEKYLEWCCWLPALINVPGAKGKVPSFKWWKTDINAVPPSKSRISDSGYDLFLLKKVKQIGKVELYDTGIKIRPEHGWFCYLIGRSSIIKSGYLLANSVGVIDRSYTGNILVPLIKIDSECSDLELPCKLVQLVPAPICHFKMIEENFEETERGDGGFGSTGNK